MGPGHSKRPFHGPAPPIAQDAAFVPQLARLAAPTAAVVAAAVVAAAVVAAAVVAAAVVAAAVVAAAVVAAAVVAAAVVAAVVVVVAAAAAAAGPKNQRQHVKAPLRRRRPIFHTSSNTFFDATDSVVDHSEVVPLHFPLRKMPHVCQHRHAWKGRLL